MPAIPAKPADADALPDAPFDYVGADCLDHAGNLMTGDAREGEARPLPFDGQTVAVAHTARFDANADLTSRRLGHFTFDNFKGATGPRHLYRPHLGHCLPPCWAHRRARQGAGQPRKEVVSMRCARLIPIKVRVIIDVK